MAKIFDTILCTAMAFLLCFSWTNYCLKNAKIALALSCIVAACSCYLISRLLTKLQNNKENQYKRKKLSANFAKYLQFNNDNAQLFAQVFKFFGYQAETIDFDNLIATKTEKTFVAICFQTAALSEFALQAAVVSAKRNSCAKLLIFANKAENSLLTLANQQIATQFLDTSNCLELFEQAEKLPRIPETKAPKARLVAAIAFNKKRFGWYLGGALFTLLTAAFSVVKLYLLMWSTVLFALANYSLLNKKYNSLPTDVKL